MDRALLLTVILQLLILALHDTVPLGRWNNLHAFRAAVPFPRRLRGSLINSVTGLGAVLLAIGWMHGSMNDLVALVILQGILLLGEFRAWWRYYFFGSSPEVRAFLLPNWQGTIGFLPERHGIEINAVHCVMHGLTLAAFVLAMVIHARA